VQSDGSWVPEFEGQRRPFEPGNEVGRQFEPGHELSTVHGFYSPRRVDPLARELVGLVLADPATKHLEAARWRPALWAWARAEAQVQLLTEYLAKCGEESGDGVGDLDADRVRSAYLLLHRAETRATTQRTRLGLDPLSAARLGRDRASEALDTAKLMERLEREEREREESGDGG
jgi:hypothetical protein